METRQNVSEMSDRELLEEIVTRGRAAEEALESLSQNPMVAAMLSGANPMAALMGQR